MKICNSICPTLCLVASLLLGVYFSVPAAQQPSSPNEEGTAKAASPASSESESESESEDLLLQAQRWEQILPSHVADPHTNQRLHVLPMPGTRLGYQDTVDEKPVLPLDWDAAPYPNEAHPNIDLFLDQRDADAVEDRVLRYLRKKPTNVDPDNTLTGTGAAFGEPIKSYYDHPRVQPRTHRSQHYQLRVSNVDGLPTAEPWAKSGAGTTAEPPGVTTAQQDPGPNPPFRSMPRIDSRNNLFTTYVKTAKGMYPKANPFERPPGTNLLPSVHTNMRDRRNQVMPNTLPSHPNNPYNLHDGAPVVSRLQTLSSPVDDLQLVMDEIFELLTDMPKRRLWEGLEGLTAEQIIRQIQGHQETIETHRDQLIRLSQWALDIIEGNDGNGSKVPDSRAYRGFPLLNHSGHRLRNKRAIPIYGDNGQIVGANIDVHQIWYGGRIQSDTMFYDFGWDDVCIRVKPKNGKTEKRWYSTYDPNWDWALKRFIDEYQDLLIPSRDGEYCELLDEETHPDLMAIVNQLERQPEPIPSNVPWTVTYTIDVLNRGEDDFSPTQVYFDDVEYIDWASQAMSRKYPAYKIFDEATGRNELVRMGPPHIAMDQTFFPMQEGTRTRLKIKMAPPRYSNVTYTWGWRNHPPRAQAVENSHKRIPPMAEEMLVSIVEEGSGFRIQTRNPETGKTTASSDHFLRRHSSFPKLPPFGRLRISDHERFTFEGINFDGEQLYGAPTLDDEIARYLPERAQWLKNRLMKEGDPDPPTVAELEAELRDVLSKLKNAPFFHPLPTRPEHALEALEHLAHQGSHSSEKRNKAYNQQFWGLLDAMYVKSVFDSQLWPQTDEEREQSISQDALDELKTPEVAQRLRENYKLMGPISRLGDLAPAKRMWRAFQAMKNTFQHEPSSDLSACVEPLLAAQNAYLDWMDRNHLPSGLRPDPKSDFTLIYLNNTIYGESSHGGLNFDEWVTRSEAPDDPCKQECDVKLTILNGDYFLHGYINPDFGGNRGWENQFKPTLAMGGAGSFFTFGRFNWRFNSEPGAIGIPPAVRTQHDGSDLVIPFDNAPPKEPALSWDGEPIYDGTLSPGVKPFPHRVWIRFNFEPSRRLRFYQFDPLHHDAAIYSIH